MEIISAIFFAVIGILVLSSALEGCALRKLGLVERALAFAAGLSLVVLHEVLNIAGLGLVLLFGFIQMCVEKFQRLGPGFLGRRLMVTRVPLVEKAVASRFNRSMQHKR